MTKNKKIFLMWLVLVIAWNFGVPEAAPSYDVLVAVLLSLFAKFVEKNV
jgi:hypothetical protein